MTPGTETDRIHFVWEACCLRWHWLSTAQWVSSLMEPESTHTARKVSDSVVSRQSERSPILSEVQEAKREERAELTTADSEALNALVDTSRCEVAASLDLCRAAGRAQGQVRARIDGQASGSGAHSFSASGSLAWTRCRSRCSSMAAL